MEAALDASRWAARPGEILVCGGMRFRVWERDGKYTVTVIDPAKRSRRGDRAKSRVS